MLFIPSATVSLNLSNEYCLSQILGCCLKNFRGNLPKNSVLLEIGVDKQSETQVELHILCLWQARPHNFGPSMNSEHGTFFLAQDVEMASASSVSTCAYLKASQ